MASSNSWRPVMERFADNKRISYYDAAIETIQSISMLL